MNINNLISFKDISSLLTNSLLTSAKRILSVNSLWIFNKPNELKSLLVIVDLS